MTEREAERLVHLGLDGLGSSRGSGADLKPFPAHYISSGAAIAIIDGEESRCGTLLGFMQAEALKSSLLRQTKENQEISSDERKWKVVDEMENEGGANATRPGNDGK